MRVFTPQTTDAAGPGQGGDDPGRGAARVPAWGQLLQAARITAAEQDLELRYLAVLEQPDGPDFTGLIGLLDSDIYDAPVAARLEAIKRGAIQSGRPRQGRVDLTDGDGWRSYELTATPRRDERGEIVGVLSIAVEVTHVLRAYAPRGATEASGGVDQLQAQTLEGIGRFAGGLAHDFNNLLTVILGYCELLRMRHRAGTELDEINTAGRRASQLTRQLLAFSRRQVLQVDTVDLNGVICGLHRMLRRVAGQDVVVTTDLADESLWVVVDVGQIEQVLLNLAVNARDAMPSGGTLRIATRLVGTSGPPADAPTPREVELTVHDTGGGMTADVRARIFEPFFTTKGDGATGLGLSTVYGIVTQSGGRIECESTPGQGTQLRVSLPLAPPPDQTAPATRSSREDARPHQAVLVVEEDALVRRLAGRALRESGYDVLEAHDVGSALRLVAQPNLAVVVSDVVMPGCSRGELLPEFRGGRPPVPVLLMTGCGDPLLPRDMSPAHLLRKPFTPSELLAKVRGLLDRQPSSPA